ncbi:hypothetical protein GCM10023223_51530 [Stackebrandtia albiflava]
MAGSLVNAAAITETIHKEISGSSPEAVLQGLKTALDKVWKEVEGEQQSLVQRIQAAGGGESCVFRPVHRRTGRNRSAGDTQRPRGTQFHGLVSRFDVVVREVRTQHDHPPVVLVLIEQVRRGEGAHPRRDAHFSVGVDTHRAHHVTGSEWTP